MNVADEYPDSNRSELDRVERLLAAKESEILRLKTELALKTLYVEELQATLESQAREMEAFDARLRRMEASAAVQAARREPPAMTEEQPAKPAPLLIRIRKAIRK